MQGTRNPNFKYLFAIKDEETQLMVEKFESNLEKVLPEMFAGVTYGNWNVSYTTAKSISTGSISGGGTGYLEVLLEFSNYMNIINFVSEELNQARILKQVGELSSGKELSGLITRIRHLNTRLALHASGKYKRNLWNIVKYEYFDRYYD